MKITEFVLFRKKDSLHFTGYAMYFGLEKRECIIKRMKDKWVVLVREGNDFEQIGLFYPERGKIRGDREYEVIGLIWTPDYTYHVVVDGDRYRAI